MGRSSISHTALYIVEAIGRCSCVEDPELCDNWWKGRMARASSTILSISVLKIDQPRLRDPTDLTDLGC